MKIRFLAFAPIISILFFTGCTNSKPTVVEPEYTAAAPVYASYVGTEIISEFEDYDGFYSHMVEFNKNYSADYYIMDPGYPQYGWGPYLDSRLFRIYEKIDGVTEFPLIAELVELYDEELGSRKFPEDAAGFKRFSIEYYFIGYQYQEIGTTGYNLEFGKFKNGIYDRYINLYVGEECIGTMHYYTDVKIPLSWFENYIEKNLKRL